LINHTFSRTLLGRHYTDFSALPGTVFAVKIKVAARVGSVSAKPTKNILTFPAARLLLST